MSTGSVWPADVASDGSIFFGGESLYTHAVGGAFMVKMDTDGNLIWAVELASGL